MSTIFLFILDHAIVLIGMLLLLAVLFFVLVKNKTARSIALVIIGAAILLIVFLPGTHRNDESFPISVTSQTVNSPEEADKQRDIMLRKLAGAYARYFMAEESTNQPTYYDYYFEYRGVRTDIAYTFVQDGGSITVYDNTHGANLMITKMKIDSFWEKHSEEDIRAQQEKQENDFRKNWNSRNTILEFRQTILYSSVESAFYSYLYYVAQDVAGAFFANELMSPIE